MSNDKKPENVRVERLREALVENTSKVLPTTNTNTPKPNTKPPAKDKK